MFGASIDLIWVSYKRELFGKIILHFVVLSFNGIENALITFFYFVAMQEGLSTGCRLDVYRTDPAL